MRRFNFFSGACLVSAVVASCVLFSGGTACAGPYQWWAWTGGAGDNDLLNPANWLWFNVRQPR